MKHYQFIILLLVCLTGSQFILADETAISEKKNAPKDTNTLLTIASLQPDSIILTVGDFNVAWKEISETVKKMAPTGAILKDNAVQSLNKWLYEYLTMLAQRGLFLMEAKQMGLTVTDEDRRQYESELEKNLKDSGRKESAADIIKAFNTKGSTLTHLSYEDVLKLLKLDHDKFSKLDVTEAEMNQYINMIKAINNGIKTKNAEKRKKAEELLLKEEIQTDEGFANLARQFSEGVEASNGGELDYEFTREDLAAINGLKEFNYVVGETTPILEAQYGFRIMRVLKEIPPKDNTQPPKYRVAQLLFAQTPLESTEPEDAKARILPQKHKEALDSFAYELAKKYPVKTLFFPEGLWKTESN